MRLRKILTILLVYLILLSLTLTLSLAKGESKDSHTDKGELNFRSLTCDDTGKIIFLTKPRFKRVTLENKKKVFKLRNRMEQKNSHLRRSNNYRSWKIQKQRTKNPRFARQFSKHLFNS